MRPEQVTPDHVLKITDDIGTCWYDLGIVLEIKEAILRNLEDDYKFNRERARKVLQIWMDKNGQDAKVGLLAAALDTIDQRRIAEKLLGM